MDRLNRLTRRGDGEVLVREGESWISVCYGCENIGVCAEPKCGPFNAIERLASYEDFFEADQKARDTDV